LRIKPADYRALHNWVRLSLSPSVLVRVGACVHTNPCRCCDGDTQGLSLQLQAMTKKGEEAEALFKLAASKYAEALAFNPNDDRGTATCTHLASLLS
jgi:hypothetical protein